jgi:hypothetical protein
MRLSQTTIIILALALGLAAAAIADDDAGDAATLQRLHEALGSIAGFEYGANSGPLQEIERIVFQLPPDSQLREPIEQSLLEALKRATTSDARRFLCRQLRVLGTARCVPVLENLLTDPEVSHMARYALGRLEFPEASEALHRALAKTTGPQLAGILNTLADRRYAPMKPDCIKLLAAPDAVVAQAAVAALGQLGGTDAAKALEATRQKAGGELAVEIDNALLACAERLAAEGNNAEAGRIYEAFYTSALSQHLRFEIGRASCRERV